MKSRLRFLLLPSVALFALAAVKPADAYYPPYPSGPGVGFYVGPGYGAYRAQDLRAFHSYPSFRAYYYGYLSYPVYPNYPVGTYPAYPVYPAAYPADRRIQSGPR